MTVIIAKLTYNITWAGISALIYASKPKLELILPSKAIPLLEIIDNSWLVFQNSIDLVETVRDRPLFFPWGGSRLGKNCLHEKN